MTFVGGLIGVPAGRVRTPSLLSPSGEGARGQHTCSPSGPGGDVPALVLGLGQGGRLKNWGGARSRVRRVGSGLVLGFRCAGVRAAMAGCTAAVTSTCAAWRRWGGARGQYTGEGGGVNFRTKSNSRRPQRRLDRRLEGVAQAVGGGYCRLHMPLRLALAVRETVAGHRLGALEGGGGVPRPLSMHPSRGGASSREVASNGCRSPGRGRDRPPAPSRRAHHVCRAPRGRGMPGPIPKWPSGRGSASGQRWRCPWRSRLGWPGPTERALRWGWGGSWRSGYSWAWRWTGHWGSRSCEVTERKAEAVQRATDCESPVGRGTAG